MATEKILVIEDDRDLNQILCGYLEKERYIVRSAYDGEEGIRIARQFQPQLLLLDIMLPKIEGNEVCRMVRTFTNAPIMIISAKSEEIDKLLLLGIGADDYLTKPFSLIELGARVKSHLRRYTMFSSSPEVTTENSVRSFGKITIDTACHKVTVCGNQVDLTAKEFKLLEFLSSHPFQVFSKDQLMDQVWGFNEFIDQNTITVYIGRLREKLTAGGACYVKTVWGVGYKWEI